MATLIAVDGYSLNAGLQKVARTCNTEHRFRIDHQRLADLLAQPETINTVSLRFYTDDQKFDKGLERPMGRVIKYFVNKGYGFIIGIDGRSYFFHHSEIINKRVLSNKHEERYLHSLSPDFRNRIIKKIVSFNSVPNTDGRFKAENVIVELSERIIDKYYQLRREPFLEMLVESGYKLVRCRPSHHSGKAKNVDSRIVLDALGELQKGDKFVLLSDDPIFIDLLEKLNANGVQITVATFKVAKSNEIIDATQKLNGQVLLLDDHLEKIQLEYDEVMSSSFEDQDAT